ncbi:GerW family sporulation protein [Haloimpatiens sp. FM7330]|uniref:GerW family sporulation protein n=1 Tax=Haloimpatiens sp. FM7330 TaxID=3298610 RepID=UPI0036410D8C
MENNSIENLMKTTLENLKDMIDVNTIVGTPIESKDGDLILPISKVSFGFASGGSEFSTKQTPEPNPKLPFGGGSGAGVSVKPVAFLVMKGDSVRLLSLDAENTYEKMIDSVPQVFDMIKEMANNKKKKDKDCCKDNLEEQFDAYEDKEY